MTRKDVFLHRQHSLKFLSQPSRLPVVYVETSFHIHFLGDFFFFLLLYFYFTRFWYFFPLLFIEIKIIILKRATRSEKYFRISSDKITKKLWSRYGKLCICAYFACFMFSLLRFSREHTKIQNLCAATLRRTIMFNPQIESNCLWKSVMFHMCRCRR